MPNRLCYHNKIAEDCVYCDLEQKVAYPNNSIPNQPKRIEEMIEELETLEGNDFQTDYYPVSKEWLTTALNAAYELGRKSYSDDLIYEQEELLTTPSV